MNRRSLLSLLAALPLIPKALAREADPLDCVENLTPQKYASWSDEVPRLGFDAPPRPYMAASWYIDSDSIAHMYLGDMKIGEAKVDSRDFLSIHMGSATHVRFFKNGQLMSEGQIPR